MAAGRYARIYFDDIARDPKFDGIRHRHDVMGSYQLLLIEAEKAWPAPAFQLPKTWVPAKHFLLLVERRIIDLDADGRFRIHGLEPERKRRSEKAKVAAETRWNHADGNAPSNAPDVPVAMPNVRAPVVSSRSVSPFVTVEGGAGGDDGRPDLEAFLLVNYRPPTPKQRDLMDGYVMAFDVTGPQRAADLILRHPDDPIGALKADLAEFRAARVAAAQRAERPVVVRRRRTGGFTGVNAEIQKMLAGQYAEDRKRRHDLGEHATNPDQECRQCQEAA